MPEIDVQIISDVPTLDRVREDWLNLSTTLPENTGFFAGWDYTHAYLRFHRPRHWVVIALRAADTGRLVGVFPLQVFQLQTAHGLMRACQPLGAAYLPYIEFHVRSHDRPEVLNALLNAGLRRTLGIDVLILWPLHETSPLYRTLLEDLGGGPFLKTQRFPDNLHEIDSRPLTVDAYRRLCRSSTLPNAQYAERRLRREGRVEIGRVDPQDHAALRHGVSALCALNQSKFGAAHIHAPRPHWPAYMAELVSELSAQGLAELVTLRCNAQVISSAICFLYKRRRSLYLYGYDPEFARFSPSKILLAHLIERTFDERGVFCFGAGRNRYKRDWALSVGELKSACVFLNPDARAALDDQIGYDFLKRLATL